MPNLSDRSVVMPASPIRRLMPYAEAAIARGTKIYHLNIGQPDIDSAPLFWEAVRGSTMKVLEYSHSAGHRSLREKLAARYRDQGIDVSIDQVMVTTAGSEALIFAMWACLNPGDEIIIPEPFYANYLGFAVECDVKVVPIPTRIEDDFCLPGIEEFERRITPRTRAILICNPNNPTGAVYQDEQLEGLRRLALDHDLFIFADEVYREFNYTGSPVKSVMQLEGLDQHAVMIDSASKRYSLCGARVGFLVSRNAGVMNAALKFGQARLSPPTLEQVGVEAALDTDADYFEDVVREYMARRDFLTFALSRMTGVLCPRIDGAFYATVRLPVDDADRFCQWMLEEFSHHGATVMMAPASGFYASPGLGVDEVRIAYVLKLEDLEAAMDCLHRALAIYPGRTAEQKVFSTA